ncbi:uncharacterized protein DEA37_0004024 [Paragonimus westermani]|uniref:Prospero domain-containing protein n=1 Tax=Paragonimus westermani TaxID=34504 RepID=A0A5J4NR88_9TREM|nr:uncharacterized protein DEA37_0004024 [Paragonimus westermani]
MRIKECPHRQPTPAKIRRLFDDELALRSKQISKQIVALRSDKHPDASTLTQSQTDVLLHALSELNSDQDVLSGCQILQKQYSSVGKVVQQFSVSLLGGSFGNKPSLHKMVADKLVRSGLRKIVTTKIVRTREKIWQFSLFFCLLNEFYYIQMEKYARVAISEGVRSADEIHVTTDSEIYRSLNLHYNRNQQLEVRNFNLNRWSAFIKETHQHVLICTGN